MQATAATIRGETPSIRAEMPPMDLARTSDVDRSSRDLRRRAFMMCAGAPEIASVVPSMATGGGVMLLGAAAIASVVPSMATGGGVMLLGAAAIASVVPSMTLVAHAVSIGAPSMDAGGCAMSLGAAAIASVAPPMTLVAHVIAFVGHPMQVTCHSTPVQ